MRITRLRLDGFGALRGEFVFDPARLALVVDDNERGKSTLLAAIAAGLYGLEDDRRSHKTLTPLDRWRPWGGGTYRVELDVETDGRRLTVKRDFDRGTVEVWDEQGREVTPEFREGKDDFPVGRRLAGLDAEEFARCSFIAAGDLARVIPTDARERGASSLRARLETAADSRLGDANATEAMTLLDGALRRYTCPELASTKTVDNTLKDLELMRGTLDTELKTLEHDLDTVRGPVAELAALEDEEKRLRATLGSIEAGRHAAVAGGVRRQLDDDARHRDEVRALEDEAASLEAASRLSPTAEAEFRETVGRHEEQQRALEVLETRRREGIAGERERIEREVGELTAFVKGSEADADRCVALAGELRRVGEEDRRLRDEMSAVRDRLAAGGHEPERLHWLQERFGAMPSERQQLLRQQSELQLAYQTEVANLERERTAATETLREVDAQRNRWQVPAWFLTALGIATAAAGGVAMALRVVTALSVSLIGGGVLLLVAGLALLMTGGRAREGDRRVALKRLDDAQRRLAALKQTRAETEVGLQILARQMGYRDHVDLLREWAEFVRLLDDSAPALRAQQGLITLEQRRQQAVDEARALLARFGGGDPEPEPLENAATGIRRALAAVRQAQDLEQRFAWFDEQKRVATAELAGHRERAIRLLRDAGVEYDPARGWEEHARTLATRVAGRVRWQTIQDELLPRARARLLDEATLGSLRAQLDALDPAAADAAAETRTPLEIEHAARETRAELDRLQARRADLRVQVEETARRFHAEHPEKRMQRERVDAALARARRFKHAAELAKETIEKVAAETHRRWADHLNQRVGELLGTLGTGIDQLRFGDDLDFSVRMDGGPQLVRGKADLQLSAGARDQLYLAVRLAVSEFLSRGQETLPFLLDDVFATSDDGRALAGLRLLVDGFGDRHQVVLLTCHRSRCDALAAAAPELFRDRVQRLDTASLTRAGA